jgi:hypothetical protein
MKRTNAYDGSEDPTFIKETAKRRGTNEAITAAGLPVMPPLPPAELDHVAGLLVHTPAAQPQRHPWRRTPVQLLERRFRPAQRTGKPKE